MKSNRTSLFLMAFTFLAASLLKAQPSLIHLSLQSKIRPDATSPVTVTWCSDNTGGKQFVRYGLTPERSKKMKTVKSEFVGKALFHADLKKLKSGTKYFYRCGSDETGWSETYSFYSEPDTGEFRVGIIGDTQNNTNNEDFKKTRIITALVKEYSPFLTLHMGDIVDNGSQSESWMSFLSVTQDLNAISPLMPVLGNHDIQNIKGDDFQKPFQDYHSLFNLPGDEVNYSFTYRNVRFVGIFSGCAQAAEEIDQVKYKPGSPEYVWLDKELANAEKDRNINWIIVWMHYPVSSFGWSNIAGWKENILPLLEKHRIDLCLAGHRHVYERHFQMKGGLAAKNESSSLLSAGDGTIYITNGTAGGNPTGFGGKNLADMAFTPDKSMYNFAIMDVSNESITYRVFDQDNTLIDRFVLVKGTE
jgi:predicted phosphohydrolase